jgi:hypothetical protein
MARASRSRTATSIQSVLRVRLCIWGRQRYGITPGWAEESLDRSSLVTAKVGSLRRWHLLQLRIQVDRPSGDVEGLGPICEAFFLDDDLMATWSY